ncbi:MAG: sigma-70 family RNA polymerase sigma factor [Phycisphaerae bacterium]|nr:sigma-70 family RNA polymerase sigma factor [Phycisphaerae bacterium]
MDDAALSEVIRGAQRGEAAAFDRLIDCFGSRVAGFLYRMTGSRQDSEDLVQEVFLRVVRMLPAYRHDGRFEPWLFRIAANLARDRIRRTRRLRNHAGEGDSASRTPDQSLGGAARLSELESAVEDVDARLVHQEEMDALNAALQEMPEAEREVVMLRHFSQLSFKEISEVTGIPLGTALARSHRGLARLREWLTDEGRSRRAAAGRKAMSGG